MSKVSAIQCSALEKPVMLSEPIVTEAFAGTRTTTLFGESVKTVVHDEFLAADTPYAKSIRDSIADNQQLSVCLRALMTLTAVDADRVTFTDSITANITPEFTTVVIPRNADVISSIFVSGGIPFTVRLTPVAESGEIAVGTTVLTHRVDSGKPFRLDIPGSALINNILCIDIEQSSSGDATEITVELECSLLKGDFRAKIYDLNLPVVLAM